MRGPSRIEAGELGREDQHDTSGGMRRRGRVLGRVRGDARDKAGAHHDEGYNGEVRRELPAPPEVVLVKPAPGGLVGSSSPPPSRSPSPPSRSPAPPSLSPAPPSRMAFITSSGERGDAGDRRLSLAAACSIAAASSLATAAVLSARKR